MSGAPIVRSVSWLNAAISLGVLLLIVLIGFYTYRSSGVLIGAIVYLALSQSLSFGIARDHRHAIRHCRKGEFEAAIYDFEKSAAFFREHEWVDRYRAITMLSAAGMSFREMALVSLGFCHGQLGDGINARKNYEQCLQEFPGNNMAKCALRFMDAGASR